MSGTPTTDHAHVLCDEVHESGPFAGGQPHCSECGARAIVVEVIDLGGLSLEGECALGLHPEGGCPLCAPEPPLAPGVAEAIQVLDPAAEAIGIVVRLANALGGLTVAELDELYGDPLAEILADAQAWSVRD